ncbi:MAG TPA: carboxy-S-adenosyl-L-methionine synthase CmoA [Candidatus Dormibacteraeota bacterium]|jgi:tRNA (cmo5U34)-methyltransferase
MTAINTKATAPASSRDEIFQSDETRHDFVFDEKVADVFDDMLDRSVPFYSEVQRMVVELAARHLHEDGVVYDIGCSTGTTLIGIASAIDPARAVRFVGLEPSEAMRDNCARKLRSIDAPERIAIRPDAIERVSELPDARVVSMLYTLQFVRPIHRDRVLRMIHDSLRPGGCLLLAEKILADDGEMRRMYIDLYHEYKLRSGYTSTEIARKREALENVLVPFSDEENVQLLHDVGFPVVEHAFRWYNFTLYVAIKR